VKLLVYNVNTAVIYVNGVSQTLTSSTVANWTDSSPAPTIGKNTNSNTAFNFWFPGYISNFRIVKGASVYTANFTPSTTPLTAITNTSLLTCQSNYFKDNSSNNFAITATGSPSAQPFSPFAPTAAYSTSVNGGSMYFDGAGDYLSTPDNAAFTLGTNNFTIEGWIYASSTTAARWIIGQTSSAFSLASTSFIINQQSNTNTIRGGICSGSTFYGAESSSSIPLNSWVHFAFVRDGTTLRIYVNGVQGGTGSVSTVSCNDSSNQIAIGRAGEYASEYWLGYITDLRFINGTCLYPSGTTFTPPTAPLTAVTNTSLLLNCTNAGIIDNSGKNDIETVGNAQVSTSVKKYGTGSISFDGTGDYFATPSSVNTQFGTGNFTIEGWVYFNSVAAGQIIVCNYLTNTPFGWLLYTASGSLVCYLGSTGSTWNIASGISVGSISTGIWYHFALVRNGSTFTPYLNGIAGTTATSSSALYEVTPRVFAGGNGNEYFNGYIDDLRVTKGVARYTANFTPPTAAFPDN